MKLTPLDIHHKEFHRAIRGYNEEEVDNFLDEVAEEFEKLFKENIDLKEQIEKVQEKAGQFESMQSTIQNVLITAQKSADEVLAQAKKDAEQIIRDAEAKARELIEEASRGKESLEARFADLKNAEKRFREEFKSMLESYMRLVEGEMARPETSYQLPEPSPAERAEGARVEQVEEESFERGAEAEYGFEGEDEPVEELQNPEQGEESPVQTQEPSQTDDPGSEPLTYPTLEELEGKEQEIKDREQGGAGSGSPEGSGI